MFEALDGNYKSTLGELSAKYFGADQPVYVHFDYGPHHSKVFLCICVFKQQITSSKGRTKVEAEQFASRGMLNSLQKCFFEKTKDKWTFSLEKKLLPETIVTKLDKLEQDPRFDVFSFYGDALLRYFVVRYLFDEYQCFPEGVLTKIATEALKEESRVKLAKYLSLEILCNSTLSSKKLNTMLCAVIGKLGFHDEAEAKKLIEEYCQGVVDHAVVNILKDHELGERVSSSAVIATTIHNFKDELQRYAQRHGLDLPTYSMASRAGAAHDPSFCAICVFNNEQVIGAGKTIKSAEQDAAKEMLEMLKKNMATSSRVVIASAFYGRRDGQLKRFKAPELKELKATIGWRYFESLDNLVLAFTHPSRNGDDNYQRLELLGDAILKKNLVSRLLREYPRINDKGVLASGVDQLISAATQAIVANQFDLGKYVFSQAAPSDIMVGNVLEALIATIQLDFEARLKTHTDRPMKPPETVIFSWFRREVEQVFGKPANKRKLFQPPPPPAGREKKPKGPASGHKHRFDYSGAHS